jgi:hypothetical protein
MLRDNFRKLFLLALEYLRMVRRYDGCDFYRLSSLTTVSVSDAEAACYESSTDPWREDVREVELERS